MKPTGGHQAVAPGTAVPHDYMEPENEWERESLLDPAWEKQQKKVVLKSITNSVDVYHG